MGSTVHCPAIKNPAPIYPILEAILSPAVSFLSLTKVLKNLFHGLYSHFPQVFLLGVLYHHSGLFFPQTLHCLDFIS